MTKAYTQNIVINNGATNRAPIFFTPNNNDPELDVVIVRVYDNKGEYMGWITPEVAKKYIYGQLYYKANRRYRIMSRADRKYIIEKNSSLHALVLIYKELKPDDFIDISDPALQAVRTLNAANAQSNWGEHTFYYISTNDKTGIAKRFNDELRKEIAELVENKRKAFYEEINAVIDNERLLMNIAVAYGENIENAAK